MNQKKHVIYVLVNYHSRLNRLTRVIAWCSRFVENCRAKIKKENRKSSELSSKEINNALKMCIRQAQDIEFAEEKRNLQKKMTVFEQSKIKSLHPMLDEDGVLKVGGRITQSTLDYEEMHPTILPANHRITSLIIWHAHATTGILKLSD